MPYRFSVGRDSENLVALLGSRHTSHALPLGVAAAHSAKQKHLQSHTQQAYRGEQSSEDRKGGQAIGLMSAPGTVSDTRDM